MARADTGPLSGGCFCGAIRYRADATPFHETVCHCADCRRIAGAPTVAWFSVPRTGFRFTSGEPARFRSSALAIRRFCPRCGTHLTYEADGAPEELDITTASLDEPDSLPPRDHTHVASKLAWEVIGDALPRYDSTRLPG